MKSVILPKFFSSKCTCFGAHGLPWRLTSKEFSACSARESDLIPGSGRPPGERHGNPLQYSCLGNPKDRGAWQATVHGVTRVWHDLVTKQPPPSRINLPKTIPNSGLSMVPKDDTLVTQGHSSSDLETRHLFPKGEVGYSNLPFSNPINFVHIRYCYSLMGELIVKSWYLDFHAKEKNGN